MYLSASVLYLISAICISPIVSSESSYEEMSRWDRVFSQNNSQIETKAAVPFGKKSALELANFLNGNRRWLKYYNKRLCPLMDGDIFLTITKLVHEPEKRKLIRSTLFNKSCVQRVPAEIWTLLPSNAVVDLNLSVTDIPVTAIPHLQWYNLKATATNHRKTFKRKAYNGWCKFLRPHQFSREIWTDDLWVILTAECVADIDKKNSQLAAIRLISEKPDLDRNGNLSIGRPDLMELGHRLVRLQSIKRALHSDHHVAIQEVSSMIIAIVQKLSCILTRNIEYLQTANRTKVLIERIAFMSDIIAYSQAGSATSQSKQVTNLFLSHFGDIDPASSFTWETISKFACKNPSIEMLELVSNLILLNRNERLPLDSVVLEALRTGSTRFLYAIIDSTRNKSLLGYISKAVSFHRKKLGKYNADEVFRHIRMSKDVETPQ